MPSLHAPDTHWLFAGRFVIYVLGLVLIIGATKDLYEYVRKIRKPPPYFSYHLLVISGSLSIMLASPAKFEVIRRLLNLPESDTLVNTLLFLSLVFAALTFILAQVTRAYNRGVPKKRILVGIGTSIAGIALLYAVGAGIDVRLP